MKTFITMISVLFSAYVCLFAEDDPFAGYQADDNPFAPGNNKSFVPCHVRVQVKIIETTQTELSQIINNPQPMQENLYISMQRLMRQKKAQLMHETLIICRSGEKSATESIREMIYPTEYEPPGLGYTPPDPLALKYQPSVRPYGSAACAYETRNVGDSLEIEPIISANKRYIDLRFAHERVLHQRDATWLTYKDQWGSADVSFPEFDTQRANTSVTLLNKQPRFISTFTPHNKEGKPDPSRKILMFVKATIITPR